MDTIFNIKNKICIFNNSRIFFILDKHNNPWFKAKDVAGVLGYKDPKVAIKDNVSTENKVNFIDLQGEVGDFPFTIQPNTIFINEPGLYKLIFRSKMQVAERFTDWVTKEVLPSIRKYGEYKIKERYIPIIRNLNRQLIERDNQIGQLTNQIENITPDITPRTQNRQLLPKFILLNLFDPESYDYYVIRCQKRIVNKRLHVIQDRHPNSQVILELEYDPNSVNLYNRMKERLADRLRFDGNYFDIMDDDEYLEEDLINDIRNIQNDKF